MTSTGRRGILVLDGATRSAFHRDSAQTFRPPSPQLFRLLYAILGVLIVAGTLSFFHYPLNAQESNEEPDTGATVFESARTDGAMSS